MTHNLIYPISGYLSVTTLRNPSSSNVCCSTSRCRVGASACVELPLEKPRHNGSHHARMEIYQVQKPWSPQCRATRRTWAQRALVWVEELYAPWGPRIWTQRSPFSCCSWQMGQSWEAHLCLRWIETLLDRDTTPLINLHSVQLTHLDAADYPNVFYWDRRRCSSL